jgi:hypothetical protein
MTPMVYACCLLVESLLTPVLRQELASLKGAPGDAAFAKRCLTHRNELLSAHGLTLEDWVRFNQGAGSLFSAPTRMAA